MQDHDFQKALLRIHGMIIPWRVAAGLQRMLDTGYLGRVTIEGRDVTTGLPREISVTLNQLQPPADGSATSTPA
jgi:hypothetical protein